MPPMHHGGARRSCRRGRRCRGAGAAKRDSHGARENKAVITATQMMESMISNPIPARRSIGCRQCRARRHRCSHAVGRNRDRTLSGQPSPPWRGCVWKRKGRRHASSERRRPERPADVEQAIARATMFTTNSLDIKAVAAMTQSGKTVLLMSRMYLAMRFTR